MRALIITEDPLIRNPLAKTWRAEIENPIYFKERIPIKIPTQNPEHLMQVKSLDMNGDLISR